ncbi:MAG: AAA family ATPase [Zavarzinella sp.]
MPSRKHHVLMIEDSAGQFTALSLEENPLAGYGATYREARKDLEKYLGWRQSHYPWMALPNFHNPELQRFKIEVRPEFRDHRRVYPCLAALPIHILCVTGKDESGQQIGILPLLQTSFTFHKPGEIKKLAIRYSMQKLAGLPPADLQKFLLPQKYEIDQVQVRYKELDMRHFLAPQHPTLDAIADPLGEKSRRRMLARAWERDLELKSLTNKILKEKASILLVGESGVGKTALIAQAVQVCENFFASEAKAQGMAKSGHRFWQTSAGRIISGMRYLGQWEARVEQLIAELSEIQGVLCVEKLLELVRTGGTGPTDSVAAFLMPYMARGELRLIGEASPTELDACRRLLPGFADMMQIVNLAPFQAATAERVLDQQFTTAQTSNHFELDSGVSRRIVQLHQRFMPYHVLPGAATRFARELIDTTIQQSRTNINVANVVERFQQRTGLPEIFLREDLTLKEQSVVDYFESRVLAQPQAVREAAKVITTFKAGLNDPQRPLGVLLFVGPTGVGKTALAESISQYLFGARTDQPADRKQSRLIRLDMSEFGGYDAATRLLGSPYGEPGTLIRQIRQQPFMVVLLDEIEKASSDIFDILLSLFDEGRLTDRFGRVTEFRSSLIIMTSNIGADQSRGFGFADVDGLPESHFRDQVMRYFRPEFYNRLDSVISFQPLQPESIVKITQRELGFVEKREGIAQRGLKINWHPDVVAMLAKNGFDIRYGARPLQRAIEREVISPLAQWLLDHEHVSQRTVEALLLNNRIVFQ